MLTVEIKFQSGGKLLPHSDLRVGGSVSGGSIARNTNLQEVGCGHVDWIGLAQDRDGWRKLVNAVMNVRIP